MSNRILPRATIPGYHGPLYPKPFERLQDRYRTRAYARRPISAGFLRAVVGSLELFLTNIEFEENFTTADGTQWFKVGFDFADGRHYVVLFPTPGDPGCEDGSISNAHIALYAQITDAESTRVVSASDQRIVDLGRSLVALVEGDFRMYYLQESKGT